MSNRRSEERLEDLFGWLIVVVALVYFVAHVVAAIPTRGLP